MNPRELAPVIAALRMWQARQQENQLDELEPWFEDIATDGGKFESLSKEEIDRLCQYFNTVGAEIR
jgi:hypothetical protein